MVLKSTDVSIISEVRLSCWTNLAEEQRDLHLAEAERIVGGLFDCSTDKPNKFSCSSVSMINPEISFISMLRYGMLALELLPDNSSAGEAFGSFLKLHLTCKPTILFHGSSMK